MMCETRLGEAFADLAGTLVGDFDLATLLHRLADACTEVCEAAGVGIVVGDVAGVLRDVAYSSEHIRRLERFQMQVGEGPCLEAFRSGERVEEADLSTAETRWPLFAPEALRSGVGSVCALPMRVGGRAIGTLNVFHAEPGLCPPTMLGGAQALADLAVLSIAQYGRESERIDSVHRHIKTALAERSVIERAKGFLAERGGIEMDEAFRRLRDFADHEGRTLTDTSRDLVDRVHDADAILARPAHGDRPPMAETA